MIMPFGNLPGLKNLFSPLVMASKSLIFGGCLKLKYKKSTKNLWAKKKVRGNVNVAVTKTHMKSFSSTTLTRVIFLGSLTCLPTQVRILNVPRTLQTSSEEYAPIMMPTTVCHKKKGSFSIIKILYWILERNVS